MPLHNYNHLVEKRDVLLKRREIFYKKYVTREDKLVEEMLTKEDEPTWEKNKSELERFSKLIEGWESGFNGR